VNARSEAAAATGAGALLICGDAFGDECAVTDGLGAADEAFVSGLLAGPAAAGVEATGAAAFVGEAAFGGRAAALRMDGGIMFGSSASGTSWPCTCEAG
jgi:hypothetical protein